MADFEIAFGNAGDARQYSQLNELLDSYEEGLILEEKLRLVNKHNSNLYDVVGAFRGYVDLIEKMREGICDDMGLVLSCGDEGNDDVPLIRYKDRESGELIRKYNLTRRGFLMNLMFFADDD